MTQTESANPSANQANQANQANNGRLQFLIIVVTSINHCCYAGISFCLTLYAVRLQATHFQIGFLIATYSLFASMTSVAAGRWADRAGARMPLLLCATGMVAGAAQVFFWRELPALFIASFLVGTLYNAFFIAQQQLVGSFGSLQDRVRIFSLQGFGIALANFVGPFCAGYALKAFGYPETFLLLACIPLVPLILIGTNRIAIPPAPAAHAGAARGGSVLDLLRIRELRIIYSVALCGSATFQLFGFLMPLYGLEIGLDTVHIGWIVGSFALGSAVSRFGLPLVSRRFSPWSVLLTAVGLAALSFAGLALSHHLGELMPVAFCLGIAFGMSNPVAQALLLEAGPPERGGEVQGLRAMMVGGVQAAVPPLAGAISAAAGISPVFGSFAVILAGCCYICRGRFGRHGLSAPAR